MWLLEYISFKGSGPLSLKEATPPWGVFAAGGASSQINLISSIVFICATVREIYC